MTQDVSESDILKQRLAGLTDTQRAELMRRMAANKRGGRSLHKGPVAAPRSPEGDPASTGQQRLWFLDRLQPNQPDYNLPSFWLLRGELNTEALRRAFETLIQRHEVLRTRVVLRGDEPVQRVDPPATMVLPVTDLSAVALTAREVHARRLAETEAWRPFDLETGPLFRAHLIRLAPDEHWLLWNVHHIASDGWSEGVFCRELSVAYDAYASGRVPDLAPLPIQYADYAIWQREWLRSEGCSGQLAYWTQTLANLPVLELPSDRPAPVADSHLGAHVAAHPSAPLVQSLEELSQREGATLFMTLLAAFQLLVHRCTGQEDITVGMPIAGRSRAELEGLVGFFVNTLVLRTDLKGPVTFRELLTRVRQNVLNASAHQDVPFERLVEVLSPNRDTRRNPLFDVMVNMSPRAGLSLHLRGLTAESVPLASTTSKFAMTLSIRPRPDGLELDLAYQCDLFSPARATGLLEQYIGLLEQVAADPGQSIGSYSLVTAGARRVLPDPTMAMEMQPQESVVDQVTAWARSSPARAAVSAEGRHWTYAELTARAEAIAATLRATGIGPGDVVAIEQPRGFELIATMLGVLMSRGVLLTLDPALPPQRKEVMLQEARARVLCRLNEAPAPLTLHHDAAMPPEQAESAAYIFFTSGSTGVPKAVLGSHQGLSHFLKWQRTTFEIGAEDRVSQLIGLTFDPLLRDVFLPLTTGAVVCVPAEQDRLDTIKWLERERVTVVHTTPTVMQGWLNAVDQPVALESLRWVFVSGEPLTATLVERWRRLVPGPAQVVNFYGPTETTMIRCFYVVPSDVERGPQPVGRPLADSQALVLNAGGGLCGAGETGEIVLRTPYRTLGYLNLPEENARRFRPNPFRSDSSDLVYFTGDRGRYREDGLLEIAGRIDDQLKIRGLRVEPGEVTVTLATHEAVRDCVVIGRRDDYGQNQLVGFVVRHPNRPVEARDLQAYVAERLPPPFVPSAIVFLDALPVLPNGKVDRNVLRTWTLPTAEAHAHEPATDLLEVRLLHIWEHVLGRHDLGLDDNFFEMGGHSLLAVRLFADIERALGVNLPLATLFQAPSVRTLAEALRQREWTPPWQSLVAIQPGGTRPPLFLVHGVGGNVVGFRDLAVRLGKDQPTFGLQSPGLDGKSAICFTVEEMAAVYVREILSLQPSGPYHLGGLSFGGRVAFEVAQQLARGGHQVGVLAMLDAGPSGYAEWLPFSQRVMERAGFWKRRIESHWRDVRADASWSAYWQRKMKTLRRKVRSRTWRSTYRDYASRGELLPQELRDVREANYLAARKYVPKPYSGTVTLFQASEHPASHARARHKAWSVLAASGVDVHEVPGDHVTLIQAPHVDVLARKLRAALDAYQG